MMNGNLFLAGLLGGLLAMAPVRLVLDHAALLETASAFAKNGSGGGNGNGNGNGGGNGNGNGGGNNGNGNGNGGSRGNGGSTGGGNAGAASDAPAASKPDEGAADAQALSVRHRNGFREQLTGGRYVMRDAQGRVVVDRRATRADRDRLKRLTIR
ncbi:hypothetical protein LRX75_10440 [Rhizobium sp. DKSPLA3]|uniref:Glycine-rich cell wall protein n=1 Tax=Rhizobium quercicola TaxID=2901226 RepID=A0A9X1NS89_9HYPH|nr:hypothetical protein [Rhizobium quercicola]MCD7109463.1 hypothetical protein [Rhizobium quercicola]